MDSTNSAIVTQPVAGGTVVIKGMEQSDAEFSGAMQVSAFSSKFEHTVGKDSLPAARNGCILEMSTRPAEGYNNIFIAWYEGERAGYMSLRYHGVKPVYGDVSFPGLGCMAKIRLACMEIFLGGLGDNIPAGACYLETLCVDEKFRGKGIGKVLLEKADCEAKEHDCKMIYLHVAGTNRAKNLYERHGYAVTETLGGCCISCSSGVDEFKKMEKTL